MQLLITEAGGAEEENFFFEAQNNKFNDHKESK